MLPTVAQVRDAFPSWTQGQCRQYRQGIQMMRAEGFVEADSMRPEHYFYGAADELGEDAEGEDWYELIEGWQVKFKWWEGSADVEDAED